MKYFYYITHLPAFLWPIKIFFIVVALVFIAYIIYSLSRNHWFKFVIGYAWVEFFSIRPFGLKKARRKWHRVRNSFRGNSVSDYERALFKAYYILEDFLDDIIIFYKYVPLSELLRHVGDATIKDVDKLREVVLATEGLNTENAEQLTPEKGMEYLDVYHKAFHSLGIVKE